MGDGMVTRSVRLTQGDLLGSSRKRGSPENERTKVTMTQQKSDRRTVPEGRRKAVSTDGIESRRGGRATTVEQQAGLRPGPAGQEGASHDLVKF